MVPRRIDSENGGLTVLVDHGSGYRASIEITDPTLVQRYHDNPEAVSRQVRLHMASTMAYLATAEVGQVLLDALDEEYAIIRLDIIQRCMNEEL
ncbi:MAG: hypothetical protein JSV63_02775 [Candidatus Aenigmatarchaeota archaeon]|nr:MAG: hypothetical protein JSV63_02775 [Candidatus Aenigmarchaeota archaeon]